MGVSEKSENGEAQTDTKNELVPLCQRETHGFVVPHGTPKSIGQSSTFPYEDCHLEHMTRFQTHTLISSCLDIPFIYPLMYIPLISLRICHESSHFRSPEGAWVALVHWRFLRAAGLEGSFGFQIWGLSHSTPKKVRKKELNPTEIGSKFTMLFTFGYYTVTVRICRPTKSNMNDNSWTIFQGKTNLST